MTVQDQLAHRRGAEDAEFPQRELTDVILAAAFEVHTALACSRLRHSVDPDGSLLRAPKWRLQMEVTALVLDNWL